MTILSTHLSADCLTGWHNNVALSSTNNIHRNARCLPLHGLYDIRYIKNSDMDVAGIPRRVMITNHTMPTVGNPRVLLADWQGNMFGMRNIIIAWTIKRCRICVLAWQCRPRHPRDPRARWRPWHPKQRISASRHAYGMPCISCIHVTLAPECSRIMSRTSTAFGTARHI